MDDEARASHAQHAAFWHILLDIIAPVAPLLGQLLHVAQPLAWSLRQGERWATLAAILEADDGVAVLRRQLTGQGDAHDE